MTQNNGETMVCGFKHVLLAPVLINKRLVDCQIFFRRVEAAN